MNPRAKSLVQTLITIVLVLVTLSCGDQSANRAAYMESAREHEEAGQHREAIIQYRNALQIRSDPDALLGLAKSFEALGEHDQAVDFYSRVAEADDTNIEAQLALARYLQTAALQGRARFAELEAAVNKIIAQDPDNIEAQLLLADATAGGGDREKALGILQEAASKHPDSLQLALALGRAHVSMGSAPEAEALFQQTVARHPDQAAPLLALAEFLSDPRASEAEPLFLKSYQDFPDEPGVVAALAGFYFKSGQPERAETFLLAAVGDRPDGREARQVLASYFVQTGRRLEAIEQLEALNDVNPNDRDTMVQLADAYVAEGLAEQADEVVAKLLVTPGAEAHGHMLKARLTHSRGDLPGALEELDAAVSANPGLIPALFDRAAVLLELGRVSDGEETLRTLLLRAPAHFAGRLALAKLLHAVGHNDDALLEADRVLKVAPSNEEALAVRGDCLLRNGDITEARRVFEGLAMTRPEDALPLHRLGTIDLLTGDRQSALDRFHAALEVSPQPEDILNDLVVLHTRDKDYDGALAELESAEHYSSRQDIVSVLRGRILAGSGDLRGAEAAFNQAIEANPDNQTAYLLLARASAEISGLDKAIERIDALIERRPEADPAHVMKGIYLYRKGDPESASASYRRALELRPTNAVAANNLAWICLESGQDLNRCLELAREARRLTPENPEYADTLGWIYYRRGNFGLAVDQLLFSVNEREPGPSPVHLYRLGMAYRGNGNLVRARESLEAALRPGIDFEGADEARSTLSLLRAGSQ